MGAMNEDPNDQCSNEDLRRYAMKPANMKGGALRIYSEIADAFGLCDWDEFLFQCEALADEYGMDLDREELRRLWAAGGPGTSISF